MKEVWSGQTRPLYLMLALPIFPGRLQPSIVGRSELNFRVRDGNGWTLALINTNCSAQLLPRLYHYQGSPQQQSVLY